MGNMATFRPYEGDAPFIFISYAHKDLQAVMSILSDMHRRGFRIWYDEGIELGSDWTESIARHLAASSLMIGFISDAYMASDNCRREMNYAVQKKKKILNVFLEPTTLTPGMELQIGGIWALMKYDFSGEEPFLEKLYEAPLLRTPALTDAAFPEAAPVHQQETRDRQSKKRTREKKQRPAKKDKDRPQNKEKRAKARKITLISVLALLIFAVGVLWAVGRYTGFIDRLENRYLAGHVQVETLPGDTVADFRNPMLEQAARDYCGKLTGDVTVGDLQGLTALYLCGDAYSFTGPFGAVDAAGSDMQWETVDASGQAVTVARGDIYDLADLRYFPSLTRLELKFQSLTTLESLPQCAIQYLDVSANRLGSLQGAGNLPCLRELMADGNPVTDVGDLGQCIDLTTLCLRGASPTSLSSLKALPGLSRLRISNCNYKQLRPLLIIGALTEVELYGCDLRGDVFDMLDGSRLSVVKLVDCQLGNVGDLDKLTAAELWLIRCTGVSDWSLLTASTRLRTLHIDPSMAQYFSDDYAFEVILEQDI